MGAPDAARRYFRLPYLDINPDYRASLLVAGTGRSGTAWVSEIVNYANAFRYMFEPFHPYEVPICKHFRYRQYLRPDCSDPAYVEPARAILSGRIRNAWIDSFNKKIIARRRLINDIRANLLLRWIAEQFPGVPIVLVLRHPCAVAASRLALHWDAHLEEFLAQDALVEDFLEPFRSHIEAADSDFERQIYLWCVENYVPLHQFRRGEIHLAFYENFIERPSFEVERLFGYLGMELRKHVFAAVERASPLSRRVSAVVTGENALDHWKTDVSPAKVELALGITKSFGLDVIYGLDLLPNVDAAYGLLRAPDLVAAG